MHRFLFLLVFMSAMLGLVENTQGQSRRIKIEPVVRPQLELDSTDSAKDEDQDDSLELGEPAKEDDDEKLSEMADEDDLDLDDDLDDDLSDDLDTEQDQASLRRVTDDQIRNNWPKHSISEIGLSLDEVGRVNRVHGTVPSATRNAFPVVRLFIGLLPTWYLRTSNDSATLFRAVKPSVGWYKNCQLFL